MGFAERLLAVIKRITRSSSSIPLVIDRLRPAQNMMINLILSCDFLLLLIVLLFELYEPLLAFLLRHVFVVVI